MRFRRDRLITVDGEARSPSQGRSQVSDAEGDGFGDGGLPSFGLAQLTDFEAATLSMRDFTFDVGKHPLSVMRHFHGAID